MRVAASFYVSSMKYGNTDYVEVELAPTTKDVSKTPGSYESPNTEWSKFTPSGHIRMNVSESRSGAVAAFESARRRRVDIAITFEIPDEEVE